MALTAKAQLSISQAAWEQLAYFALRPELYYDSLAEVKPTHQSTPGTTVTFTFSNEMAEITAALGEGVDAVTVQIGNNQVQVTLAEYGSAVQTTAQLRATAFYAVNPVVANLVGWNAGSSVDGIARSALATNGDAYANRIWSGAAVSTASAAKLQPIFVPRLVHRERDELRLVEAGDDLETLGLLQIDVEAVELTLLVK